MFGISCDCMMTDDIELEECLINKNDFTDHAIGDKNVIFL